MSGDGVPEVGSALAHRGDRAHDRRAPPTEVRHVEHRHEVAFGLLDAGPVGLVDHQHVGHLEQPRLVGLHRIAPARVDNDNRRVGRARHLDLDLADADGLEQHPGEPGGVEDAHRFGDGEGETTQVAAARHRPDEDAGVGGVALHPHPVAEDGTAGER